MCPPWVQWSRLRGCHREKCRSKTCYVACNTLEVSVAVGGHMDLDLRKVRYFVAVAEELNFGRAAERLHIAQPVLSRQVRSFEGELGVELFARDSRGTRLTAAGKQLLTDARFLLAESKALRQRLSRVAEPTVTVTVGVMPGLLATAAAAAFEDDDPSRRAVVVQVGWAEQV